PVGTPIAIIGKAGDDISKLVEEAKARASAKAAPAAAKPAAAPAVQAAPAPAAASGTKVLASPLARRLATDLGIDLRGVQGTGPGGRIVERDVKAAAEGGANGAAATDWHAAEEAPQTSAPR